MWADPEVVRHIGGQPLDGSEVWHRLLRYAGHWAWLGYGFWAVEDRATGAWLGELGFADFHRDITPSITVPECGWVFAPAAHGRGFATEGVLAATAWADARFGGSPTVSLIAPDNAASLRVAKKCGFGDPVPAAWRNRTGLLLRRRSAAVPV